LDRICSNSAQKCANSERAAQTCCQPAEHAGVITDAIFEGSDIMRPIPSVLCTFFALLTVLSFIPVMMLFCTCLFSSTCVLHNFAHAMAFPGLHRKLAIVMVAAPPLATLSYILIFLGCQRSLDAPADVLDRRYRALD
jgi:hypothetical protein